MKCCDCDRELSPNSHWVLDGDHVCQQCYGRGVEVPPEDTFAGAAIGVSMGLVFWFGVVSFAGLMYLWIAQ